MDGYLAQVERTTTSYLNVGVQEGPTIDTLHRAHRNHCTLHLPSTCAIDTGNYVDAVLGSPDVEASHEEPFEPLAPLDTRAAAKALYGDAKLEEDEESGASEVE